MTLASLKEAEALVALEVGSDTVVAAAGTGWRATDSSLRDKLRALGDSGLIPCSRVCGAVVDSRQFIRFHGSGGRSGGSGQPWEPSPDQPSCPWEATPEAVLHPALWAQLAPPLLPSSPHFLPRHPPSQFTFFPRTPLLFPFLCILSIQASLSSAHLYPPTHAPVLGILTHAQAPCKESYLPFPQPPCPNSCILFNNDHPYLLRLCNSYK